MKALNSKHVKTGLTKIFLLAMVCITLSLLSSDAQASAVLTLGSDGTVHNHNDRFLPPPSKTDLPVSNHSQNYKARPTVIALASNKKAVTKALKKLLSSGDISQTDYKSYLTTYKKALRTYKKLSGSPKQNLGKVITTLQSISARGELTKSRLKPLFLTLERNRQWWITGKLLSYGQRISFSGSSLIFQYYPGEGVQLQMLANWAKANQYWSANDKSGLKAHLSELTPLAADRADGIAWEYYFTFDGGTPPWTSSISQGTAIQALSRASILLNDTSYATLASSATGVFKTAPPTGLKISTGTDKAHYIMYSFNKNLRIINGFIQSLVGLYDFANLLDSDEGRELFRLGDNQARAELSSYDTGAWSLYRKGKESDLGYHKLTRDFLRNLCNRTETEIYCDTAENFALYLKQLPEISLLNSTTSKIRFSLSKKSKVGITVTKGSKLIYSSSGTYGYGKRSFAWRAKGSGTYTVKLSATDLAGNSKSVTDTLEL